MKNIWHEIRDYVIIIAIVVLVRTFLVTPAIVDGASMDYTLEDGQLVFINKLIYRIKDIKRFDIVVVNNEINKDKIIKRVIGLPGETIRYTIIDDNGTSKGVLYINDNIVKEEFLPVEASSKTCIGKTEICETGITLGKDEYFVMGDNREVSKDSRMIGTFTKKQIVGRVKFRVFPFNKFGTLK